MVTHQETQVCKYSRSIKEEKEETMSNDAAAAFFANKKKKKKNFKFNANKIDISQITSPTHV